GRSAGGSRAAVRPRPASCTAEASTRRTPPPSSPNASSMAYWWAAPHSIPKAGRNLCRPALPRYFPGRMYNFLLILLTLDALILTTAVLLQAGQGGGLASLGGGAGTEQFMGGRQATTLLTKITWWCAGIFLFISLVLAFMSAHSAAPRSVLEGGAPAPAPVQPTPLPLPASPAPQNTPPQPSNQSPPPHR